MTLNEVLDSLVNYLPSHLMAGKEPGPGLQAIAHTLFDMQQKHLTLYHKENEKKHE